MPKSKNNMFMFDNFLEKKEEEEQNERKSSQKLLSMLQDNK